MTYHIFTNDANGYSCFTHLEAENDREALRMAIMRVRRFAPVKVLAIPEAEVSHAFQSGSGRHSEGLKPASGTFAIYGAWVNP